MSDIPRSEEVSEPVKKKKKRQRGYVKYAPLTLLFLSVCAFVFCFSLCGMYEQPMLDSVSKNELNNIYVDAFVPDGKESFSPSDPNVEEIAPTPESHGSWQSISPKKIKPESLPFLAQPNFSTLKQTNSQTKAWFYWPSSYDVKGLPINMPVVQAKDNDYYLTRNYNRVYNENGWVYFDYRNDLSVLTNNRNTIIYGHARSYQIFGGLKYLDTYTKWIRDGYNHFIYINTPTERTVWQVFSWHETNIYTNYIQTEFRSDEEYVAFLNRMQKFNELPAFEEFEFTPEDRILTLSTCKGTDKTVRVAVHAVLVKSEWIGEGEKPAIEPLPPTTSTSTSTSTSTQTDSSSTNTGTPSDTSTDTGTPDVSTDSSEGTTDAGSSTSPPSTDPVTDTETDGTSSTDSATVTDADSSDVSASTEPAGSSSEVSLPPATDVTSDTGTPSDSASDTASAA
ncbi:MAG: sortase [Clostridia bacterium]|nr:sortase [Clostridia bacterium]